MHIYKKIKEVVFRGKFFNLYSYWNINCLHVTDSLKTV